MVWTGVSVWMKPVWNVADYGVTATWKESEEDEVAPLVREGTLELPADAGPLEMLKALVRVLERGQDQAESLASRRTQSQG